MSSNFSKSTTIILAFDKADITYTNLQISSYTNAIQVQTRADETVTIQFANKDELKQFVDRLITMATKLNWTNDYDSESIYTSDSDSGLVTVGDVLAWKEDSARIAAVAEDQG